MGRKGGGEGGKEGGRGGGGEGEGGGREERREGGSYYRSCSMLTLSGKNSCSMYSLKIVRCKR